MGIQSQPDETKLDFEGTIENSVDGSHSKINSYGIFESQSITNMEVVERRISLPPLC